MWGCIQKRHHFGGQWRSLDDLKDLQTLIRPQIWILHPKKSRKRHPTCLEGCIWNYLHFGGQWTSLDDLSVLHWPLNFNPTKNSDSPTQKTLEKTPHMCKRVYSKMTSILEVIGWPQWLQMTSNLWYDLKYGFSIPENLGKDTKINKIYQRKFKITHL